MQSEFTFPNGFAIRLRLDGRRFLGLGDVAFHGTHLRSPDLPWTLYTESETSEGGVRFETFELAAATQTESLLTLNLRSRGTWMPRIQEADAMGEARIRARRVHAPEAEITWTFRPITERIFENEWPGLAMRITYACPEWPIHWLLEDATWEIGGSATGSVLIQQDVSTIQFEEHVKDGSAFSTIEKFFTDGWGGSFPMDMLPRGAGACICDFQAKDRTALCLFAESPGLTRARIDKFANEEVIHYLDRAYFPLCERASTPERKLLAFQASEPLPPHATRNLWLDCFTEVRKRVLSKYGFESEIPVPRVTAHLWDKDLKERLAAWPDPMEQDIPDYARMGYKQLFTHGVWESVTSDPQPAGPGNICNPYAFRFAEIFGGAARMKKLNDTAQGHDIQIMQWFSFHRDSHAPIWKEHPDWVLREANGDPWDGNYNSLWSGRIRSRYGEFFKNEILDVLKETGISGIFWDSYQNLGITCLDWSAPDKAPQADEIFRLQAELQRHGFRQICEVTSIFGVGAVAIFGFEHDKFRRRLWDDFVSGDQAFALLDCSPSFFCRNGTPIGIGRLDPEKYFWLAAHRCVPGISADPWGVKGKRYPGGDFAEGFSRVNHLYNKAVSQMHRLRLQAGGTHVLWLDAGGEPAVIWAFREEALPATESGTWIDAEDSSPANGRLVGGHVYLREV